MTNLLCSCLQPGHARVPPVLQPHHPGTGWGCSVLLQEEQGRSKLVGSSASSPPAPKAQAHTASLKTFIVSK